MTSEGLAGMFKCAEYEGVVNASVSSKKIDDHGLHKSRRAVDEYRWPGAVPVRGTALIRAVLRAEPGDRVEDQANSPTSTRSR
jgi:hypothetical protein